LKRLALLRQPTAAFPRDRVRKADFVGLQPGNQIRKFTDQQIAATLNRLRLRTGEGNSWNVMRVRSARSYYQLPAFAQNDQPREVTLQIAARRLNVSQSIVRRMIEEKILPARQAVPCAPWQIPMEALGSETIRQEANNIK